MTIAARRLSGAVATFALGWLVSCNIDKTALFRPEAGVTPPPPAGSRLAFTAQPHDAAAGSVITPAVQVTVLDKIGDVVTSFIGDVTIALDPNQTGATLTGTTTVTAADGVATFADLSIDQPGTGYTLTASADGLTNATSDAFDITAAQPGTGDLTVTTSTTGGTPDPDGYTATLDGGASRTFAANETFTLSGVAAGSHTVVLSDVADNCSVSGGTSRTVQVPAGGTSSVTFSVACPTPTPQTGTVSVTTNTSGGTPDPDGYTVAVSVAGSQAIGTNATVTFSGVAAGSHTVTLSGIAGNCTVSGGTSRTVDVPAGGTVSASFTISCPTPSGSVSVTTSTSGGTPDPDGYTVAVSGAGSQSIGTNATVTFSGVATGSHTVTLSGIAGNCTVSGGTSRTVDVPAGGTASASFTVDCPTPPPQTGTLTVTTNTSGTMPDPDGYTVTVSGVGSQPIGTNQTVTYENISAGSHTVTLSGIAANCTVAIGPTRTVNVPPGGVASTTFTISCPTPAPPATRLVFSAQPPATMVLGAPFTVQVTGVDNQGNVVPTFTGPVTIRIASSTGVGGSLSGTTQVNAVGGRATFSSLRINAVVGTYTLGCSASGLTGATSSSILVAGGGLGL
jgi:hypothetical protein